MSSFLVIGTTEDGGAVLGTLDTGSETNTLEAAAALEAVSCRGSVCVYVSGCVWKGAHSFSVFRVVCRAFW